MSEEKITFENKITAPFTWVENELLRSKSLSLEAIGLYMILRSFGGTSYPSVDYLCSLGKTGRDRLWRVMNELIENKLLLRKQEHRTGGKFSKTIYRIISLNDNYEEVYKEFIGEEPKNPQTLNNSQFQPCTEKPCTAKPCTENPTLIRIIKEEESFKEKKSHTKKEEEVVCEEIEKQIEKIKEIRLYQNSEDWILKNQIIKYGMKEVLKAAKYLDEAYKNIQVRNPAGLLITTLRNKLYSEIQENNKNNNINTDVEKLNMQYRGFKVDGREIITGIFNIGGRIAFRTNDITKDMSVTPARNYEDFVSYLNKFGIEFNTS
ncbi:MAG: helix-turn-helix domain-containing protein [Deltaproteobacteria bacterium]|nr:helix-turn-helix domain-containing protein [Deltaproteobacteria bacterium]MCL5891895.1 helix-turn-helix domain-containing protein [Deltaproteobacteria bacterium]